MSVYIAPPRPLSSPNEPYWGNFKLLGLIALLLINSELCILIYELFLDEYTYIAPPQPPPIIHGEVL